MEQLPRLSANSDKSNAEHLKSSSPLPPLHKCVYIEIPAHIETVKHGLAADKISQTLKNNVQKHKIIDVTNTQKPPYSPFKLEPLQKGMNVFNEMAGHSHHIVKVLSPITSNPLGMSPDRITFPPDHSLKSNSPLALGIVTKPSVSHPQVHSSIPVKIDESVPQINLLTNTFPTTLDNPNEPPFKKLKTFESSDSLLLFPIDQGVVRKSTTIEDSDEDMNEHVTSPTRKNVSKCISSLDLIHSNLSRYIILPNEPTDNIIELLYPASDSSETFMILTPKRTSDYNPVSDLKETVICIVKCIHSHTIAFGDEKQGPLRQIIKAVRKQDMHSLALAIRDFNSLIMQYRALHNPLNHASYSIMSHILDQVYSRTVAPVSHSLSKTKGFSNTVYGEVKYSLVHEFINKTLLKKEDVFLDMGSGIGNVVLQVAGETGAESYGVEIMSHLHVLAQQQKEEFEIRMKYYGLAHGDVMFIDGDFLSSPVVGDVIKRADVIFINNYGFDPELQNAILNVLLDCKESVKILTLRSLCVKLNGRNLNSIDGIFNVQEIYYGQGCVSWMNEGGTWYLQTVDRKKASAIEIEIDIE